MGSSKHLAENCEVPVVPGTLHSPSTHLTMVIITRWAFPQSDNETRISIQMVYIGGQLRKHQGTAEVREKR